MARSFPALPLPSDDDNRDPKKPRRQDEEPPDTDFLHVLTDVPWLVFGHYLTVEPWIVDFSSAKPHPNKVVAWIHLPGLSITLYKRSLISEIGECIGRVIKLYYQIEGGRRCRFARMAVSVDLSKPLVSKVVVINGRVQLIEYEFLSTICYELHANNIIPLPPFDPYGPWMVVDRRHLRPPKNPIASTERPLENLHAGSRFDPLLADQNENIGPVQNQSATPSVSPAPPIDPTPDYNEPLPKARMLST
ncbi:hypothetical protein V6N11_054143 [Hibiscus sabdariffa]|uniref:DUF4283 domain-containing protein n=1 Tax=Hibiscus sabdariffa TaxID=183260 RepID=A0ABR2S3L5_9ROSI